MNVTRHVIHHSNYDINSVQRTGLAAARVPASRVVHAYICNCADLYSLVVCGHHDVRGHPNDPWQSQFREKVR